MTEGFGALTVEKQAELQAIVLAKAAEAEVQAAYIMAMKNPRNEENARVNLLRACKNIIFARKAKYRKPVGDKQIVGPSIRLAEEVIRVWGNILTQQISIYEDDVKRINRLSVRDLQTNTAHSKEFTIDKTVERKVGKGRQILGERTNTNGERVFIVKATEDELNNKESLIASKVIRNNSLRLVPTHIVDEALAIVDETLRLGAKADPEAAKRQLLDEFAAIGINPSDLETYLKHAIAQLSPPEIVELQDMANSIKDGQAKWSDYLESPSEKPEPASAPLPTFQAGDPAMHTPVDQPVAVPSSSEQEGLELWNTIQFRVRKLEESSEGQKMLQETYNTWKVKGPEQVSPANRSLFLDSLIRAEELMADGKKRK